MEKHHQQERQSVIEILHSFNNIIIDLPGHEGKWGFQGYHFEKDVYTFYQQEEDKIIYVHLPYKEAEKIAHPYKKKALFGRY